MVVLESGTMDMAGAGVEIAVSNNPVRPIAIKLLVIVRILLQVGPPE